MNLTEIIIENYKSIEKLKLQLNSYGNKSNESKTTILVGINESGKSNILDSINSVNHQFENHEFETTYYKLGDITTNEFIDVFYNIDQDSTFPFYLKLFSAKIKLPTELINSLKVEKFYRNIFFDKKNEIENYFAIEFENNLFWDDYCIETSNSSENVKEIKKVTVKDNAVYLNQNQKLLTKDDFELLFIDTINERLKKDFPKIIYWKSTPEHLINEKISLINFKSDTSTSLPLKNIFGICNYTTDQQIEEAINRALEYDEFKAELEESLTKATTDHINKIWKEHKVKIKIKFDGDDCKVHVEDLSTQHKYYKMKHRSDGFKQFISLMLSLSAENKSNLLKNNIIILDEPEVHLHPSGIRFLRDEILKIGKNNHVIVATHSHYLIDTNTPERHFIVEKNKKTTIKQLTNSTNFSDDEVISKAFGLNIFKELIPENILIVEGFGDKSIFNHCFSLLSIPTSYIIKNASSASKIDSFAALIAEERINSIIILDDDKIGRQKKSEIIRNLKNHFSKENVFTIRDILSDLPEDSTLEDLYPIDFLNETINIILERKDIAFSTEKNIIDQLKSFDKTLNFKGSKDRLDKIKIELNEKFRNQFKTKEDIEKKASRLTSFCKELAKRLILREQ
ncbi:AAA family ATPase [Flavobacterium beibuense]|uniref:ATP-dependent endonuclease of the OLD family-like protein n=1 Tax=Flavobacterium beibuense TaxID=657326 RepID=A0A444W7H6_9FLAO|nr:AAA family ATPase [Flavobacterium beibuense]RYJ41743.1 ATP-dependent endonuclease of the OLD family-like protein [Flavobacterium beibuense]